MIQPQLAVLNHVLAQSPELQAAFAQYAGRRVRVELPPLVVHGVVCDNGLWGRSEGDAEAVIRVRASALLAWNQGRAQGPGDAELSGDTDLALGVATLLARLRWDAAEDLARVVGDAGAHKVETVVRGMLGVKGQIAVRLAASYAEHVREEIPLLASRPAVVRYLAQVDVLRDASERALKRLERLEAGLRGQSKE